MDTRLNEYLEQIEKHLKPLPVSERVDIVQEIKSEMQELQAAGQTPEQILRQLGESWGTGPGLPGGSDRPRHQL